MLRGNLMRGGILFVLVVLLWAPLTSALPGPARSEDPTTGVSVPEWIADSGWLEAFQGLLRLLSGADDGEGGGTLDPSGAPGDGSSGTSEGGSATEPTGTTTETGGEPLP